MRIPFQLLFSILIVIILASCGEHHPVKTITTSIDTTAGAHNDSTVMLTPSIVDSSVNPNAAFNVSAMIGADIDSVRKILGKSMSEPEPNDASMEEWSNLFYKSSNLYKTKPSLLVTFYPNTRKVKNYFLSASVLPNEVTTDIAPLLELCNVTKTDPRYTITAVPVVGAKSVYTGILITAK